MKHYLRTICPVFALLAGAASFPLISVSALAVESVAFVAGPINKNCPIMGGGVDTDTPTREFKGVTIGFCCPGCDLKWDKKTDAEKMSLLAKTSPEVVVAILSADASAKPAALPAPKPLVVIGKDYQADMKAIQSNPPLSVARGYLAACARANVKTLDTLFLDKGRATVSENSQDEGTWEAYRDQHLIPELKEMPDFAITLTKEDIQTFGATTVIRHFGTFTVPDAHNKEVARTYLAAITYVVVDEGGSPKIAHLHWSSRAEKKPDLSPTTPESGHGSGPGHDHK